LANLIASLSRSHHKEIIGAAEAPAERYFYMAMLVRERWSVRELRRQIDSGLFGKELTFVGEEYTITVGHDTFSIDLLFFHRRLQCLIAVDLKVGKFRPEYVGKVQFYCAALDEQVRLPYEKPSLGLVLCKSADRVQVRLALTAAANKIGVATYQTALPNAKLIRQRLEHLPAPSEVSRE
jgi:hypothetical protein